MDTPASETPGRSRGWVIVINNYTEDDKRRVALVMKSCVYAAYAYEVGPTTGTPHIQMYAYYANARSMMSMKKALPRANLTKADGSAKGNRTYIFGPWEDPKGKKDSKPANPTAVEVGEMPQQGKRSDLQNLYAMLENGASMNDVLDTEPNLQCLKVAETWLKYKEPARDWKTDVHWFHGDPGTGKSQDAEEAFKGVFYSPPPTSVAKFWDCYDADENVIIDELEPGDIPYRSLLRMFDRYAYRLETKGGSRQLRAKTIYVCTEDPPEAFVPAGKDPYALMRRLTSVTHYKRAPGAEPTYYPTQHVKLVGVPESDIQFPPADLLSACGVVP